MSAKRAMWSLYKNSKKKKNLSRSQTQNLQDSAYNKGVPTACPISLHKNVSPRIYITISEWFQHSVLDHTLISGPQYNSTKLWLNLGKWLGGRFSLHKLSLWRPPFILIYKQYNLFLDNELNIATIQQKSNYCCYPNGPSLYYPNRELGPA